jgi:hypothetical protein
MNTLARLLRRGVLGLLERLAAARLEVTPLLSGVEVRPDN